MAHSIRNFSFYHTREQLLEERLAHIRATMRGDNIDVRALIADKDGRPSSSRAADLARRMTEALDDLQKAYWLTTGYEHDDESERLMASSPAWQELLARRRSYEEEVAFDLSQAPTTLSQTRRQTVEDLFYCALWSCCCEALGRTSIGAMREALWRLSELAPSWSVDGESERGGFSEEALALKELEDETEVGPDRRWYPDSDIFDTLDALYEILTERPATALVDPEVLERVRASDDGREILGRRDLERQVWREWGSESLRLLTALERGAWEALELDDRYRAVLLALDDCDAVTLASLSGSWELQELLDTSDQWRASRDWEKLGADARRQALAAALEERMNPYGAGESGELDDLDAWYEGELQRFHEEVRAWAEQVGGIDELFARYRSLRVGFFAEGLPKGAYPGFSELAGRWFAEGFATLANSAVDTVLGEEGLSWTFDDDVFHRTYAYLGEASYQMETVIERKGEHRG